MKQIQMEQIGMDKPLKIVEIEIPKPKKGEVLIKTKAFAINPVDVKTRNGGGVYGRLKNETAITLGWDISGEIVEVGEGVKGYEIGDTVFGMVNFPGHGKAYAEYVTAPIDHLAHKPSNISHIEAAASTLAALTAYQILSRHLKSGDRVFIQSAAGGVGHFAVQIAKILGAYTNGAASDKNADYLKTIGLDKFVNYKTTDFERVLSEIDFALDTMAGEILNKTIKIMKKGGKIISIPTGISAETKKLASQKGVTVDFELVESNGEDMKQLADWLSNGDIKPYIFKTYSFDEIEQAHKQILSGTTRGKLVIALEE